jgi:hypothetical protein
MSRRTAAVDVGRSIKQTTQAFTFIEKNAVAAAKAGVREHLEMVGTESQRQVPRITRKLAGSMRIEVRERPAVFGTIDYLAPYAVRVHEEQRPPSSNGKWKYLEDPFKAQEGLFAARVGDAVATLIDEASKGKTRSRNRDEAGSWVLRKIISAVKGEMRDDSAKKDEE